MGFAQGADSEGGGEGDWFLKDEGRGDKGQGIQVTLVQTRGLQSKGNEEPFKQR